MVYSTDRTEGDFAIFTDENGESVDIPLSELEKAPSEGDIFVQEGGRFVFSPELTESRRSRAARRTRALFDKK